MIKKVNYTLLCCTLLYISLTYTSACNKEPFDSLRAEPNEEYSGGLNATTFDFSENAFGREVPGLSNTQLDDFVVGNSFFRNNWVTAPASATARDGLGALFNSLSCGGCHVKDGRAAPPSTSADPLNGLLFRLSIPGISAHGGPLAEPNYGGQLNNRAIQGVLPEGSVSVSYDEISGSYPDGMNYSLRKPIYLFIDLNYGALSTNALYSPRIANQVMGLGLLEAIPESNLLTKADESDNDGDGISGRPNKVWNALKQATETGRFGWKANQPDIAQQTAGAFLGDIGITSNVFPDENLTTFQQTQYGSLPNGGNPEIEADDFDRVVSYMRLLAVPGRRDVNDPEVLQGKQLFFRINCIGCHVPSFKTVSPVPQLNSQEIRPYTDLLLHDMGDALADGRPDFLATGNEWRTPPLWGIGLIKTVNGHTTLLHDGRARNIEEAILWHGGEATKSKDLFIRLTANERAVLIRFLESL